MDRLQAVAHVRQRAADDHAHRVVEVAARSSSSMRIGTDAPGLQPRLAPAVGATAWRSPCWRRPRRSTDRRPANGRRPRPLRSWMARRRGAGCPRSGLPDVGRDASARCPARSARRARTHARCPSFGRARRPASLEGSPRRRADRPRSRCAAPTTAPSGRQASASPMSDLMSVKPGVPASCASRRVGTSNGSRATRRADEAPLPATGPSRRAAPARPSESARGGRPWRTARPARRR